MKAAIQNILRVFLGALTMTALMMAVLFAEAHAATKQDAKPVCSLMGEGVATAGWVKHRIFIGEEAVFGANDMNTVTTELKNLRHSGRCL